MYQRFERKKKIFGLLTFLESNGIIQTINILEGDINDLLYRYYELKIRHFRQNRTKDNS